MIWAQNLPMARPEVVGSPSDGESWSPWKRRLVVTVIVVLTLVAVLFGASRYFRLGALDDYRTGYALGSVWKADSESVGKCQNAMYRLYDDRSSMTPREPGWGEFRVGCEDGLSGEPPISWYGLRERLWGGNGGD
jgi:hypothetical protein